MPNNIIHPTAIIGKNVALGLGNTLGPYCVVEDNVHIGDNNIFISHVIIGRNTVIGSNNKVFQFCSIGVDSIDKKYKGEDTWTYIGDRNILRESVTIHRGTIQDQARTIIGHDNLIMIGAHVAHDCVLGNYINVGHGVALAGHVHIADYAVLSVYTLVHQYSQVGAYAFLAPAFVVRLDIPAYTFCARDSVIGLNVEAMRKHKFPVQDITLLKKAYRILYRDGHTLEDAIALLEQISQEQNSSVLIIFIDSLKKSNRGILR